MSAGVEVPETMARLYRGRGGLPVPHVAAWSSERWGAIRFDPLVGRQAIFTTGRQGRGRALFGVTNEERQRACMVRRLCGVCAAPLEGPGWWPNHDRLIEQKADVDGRTYDVTHEPPCCHTCATWSATGCAAIGRRTPNLLRVDAGSFVLQLIDPSRAPGRHDPRFDGPDNAAERERLGRIARRHGGAVGYVKLVIVASEVVDLEPSA